MSAIPPRGVFLTFSLFMLLMGMGTGFGAGCNGVALPENTWLKSLKTVGINADSISSVVVIPGSGCGGCIDEATQYVISHNLPPHVAVVFTGVISLKSLKLIIGSSINRDRFVIDSANLFYNPSSKGDIYPKLAYKGKGRNWLFKQFTVADSIDL
jgi:hypothetical protein